TFGLTGTLEAFSVRMPQLLSSVPGEWTRLEPCLSP
ncbi:unnamed protein product, partial [Tetraodon nigroviridis]